MHGFHLMTFVGLFLAIFPIARWLRRGRWLKKRVQVPVSHIFGQVVVVKYTGRFIRSAYAVRVSYRYIFDGHELSSNIIFLDSANVYFSKDEAQKVLDQALSVGLVSVLPSDGQSAVLIVDYSPKTKQDNISLVCAAILIIVFSAFLSLFFS